MTKGRHRISGAGKSSRTRGLSSRRRRNESRFRTIALVIAATAAAIIVLNAIAPGWHLPMWRSAGPPALNDVDPLSGKPVGRFSPRVTYESHTIAFCCNVSKNKWVQLPKDDKDAFVLRLASQPQAGEQVQGVVTPGQTPTRLPESPSELAPPRAPE